ncbi:MAG: N-acetyl-gamma-glutamyl-phosphate reductase [bacterium]|nr:N-acetyl-gamma-glutamyl-phosphate reductase [bacterium]
MSKINTSIIGATGYTGIELLKFLLNHPNVEIKHLTSSSFEGPICEIYPHLCNISKHQITKTDPIKVAKESDVVFLALPHGESCNIVPQISGKTKIIDLANDYRLSKDFIYGLPEINDVKKSSQIANPGCFAIATQLALYPLKKSIKHVNIVAITGSSGSGKTPSETTHHPIRNHNVKSYKIGIHQHIPEIIQTLEIQESQITMIPTSGPFTRGIHLTAFVEGKTENASKTYKKAYKNAPFIRIKDNVELANVIGSNFCDISIHEHNGQTIIQAVIDNLIKGAAGTAIQNFNLMNNLKEDSGLRNLIPIFP